MVEVVNKEVKLLLDQLSSHCIATLMLIFVQLHRHPLLQREDQAVSSIYPIDLQPECFAHSGRSQTVEFYST